MKLSKVLLGSAVLAALAFGFVSCSSEDDDDEEGAISGSNNNYSVSYTNSSENVYRAYKPTIFKHRGALCQITINKDSDSGAMGYMWDLDSTNPSRTARAPRTFLIAGFNYNHTATDKVAYYVSRYTNVVDIEEDNFGAGKAVEYDGTAYTAVEREYIALNSSNSFEPTKDESGNVVVTIDVYEDGEWTWNSSKTKRTYTSYNGGYCVDFYNGATTLTDIANNKAIKITLTSASNKVNGSETVTATATVSNGTLHIPAADLGYTVTEGTTDTTKSIVTQYDGAVYTNVYAGSTLNGSWKYNSTYSEAEEVVE